MKAKDKKAIAILNEEIEVLRAREVELEKMWDEMWERDDVEAVKASVEQYGEEYEAIDSKVSAIRGKIREIRDADLIARGYGHELNLARANID